MRAVATVPFLSLISFQRLSAAAVAPLASRVHSVLLLQRLSRASAIQKSALTEPSHRYPVNCVKSDANLLQQIAHDSQLPLQLLQQKET